MSYLSNDPLFTDELGNRLYECQDGFYTIHVPHGKAVNIPFQQGNPNVMVNGITNEILLQLVIARVTKLNKLVPSKHNEMTIKYLQAALLECKSRRSEQVRPK